MVRFARARGSKSSNERQPEEATSWQQLKEPPKHSSNSNNCLVNANTDNSQVIVNEWAAFPPASNHNTSSDKEKKEEHILTAKQRRRKIQLINKSKPKKDIVKKEKKIKKKILKECKIEEVNQTMGVVPANEAGKVIPSGKPKKDIVKFDKKTKKVSKECRIEEVRKPTKEVSKVAGMAGVLSKRQKRNAKQSQSLVKVGKRRKAPPVHSTISINGIPVEVTTFDGYTVTKQDGDRLIKLRQDLIAKKVPEDEVKLVLKAERRKAERSLAREKKKVCFHCRQSGHNLSECPKLESSETDLPASGICFKCGSTEHTHLACKVNKSEEFRFAKCFICQEQGHISVQCPDNPRGLYPKGGGCKICSDVTHLKKDCPQLVEAKEREDITLEMGTEF